MTYASFWKRTAAYVIDQFICQCISFVIAFILGLLIGLIGGPDALISLVGFLVGIVVWAIYFAWTESSAWQATIGKKLMGLKVTDLNGQRIGFWRSVGRNLGMIISGFILCIGYLMCFWTEKRQCLHDKMAGCLVVDTTPNEKQGCAAAVIIVWILGIIVFMGMIAAIALPQYVRAVERSRMAEAYQMLGDAVTAQQIYKISNGTPATKWNQLDVALNCTVQNNPQVCVSQNFTYELSRNTVTATRNRPNNKYILAMDLNGKKSCNGENDFTQALCERWNR